jgi:hypothetical protein
MTNTRIKVGLTVTMTFVLALVFPSVSLAHCDSLDGPVVLDAKAALERKDVSALLKWVKPEDESLIREVFDRTLAVRQLGPEAKALADSYFFDTLVRVHRLGEGAPYTGLKPAGSIKPVIQEADRALDSGSIEKLAKAMSEHTAQGLRERFARAAQARPHAAESAHAGREYVEAYGEYVHYVEALAEVVHGMSHHEGGQTHP